MNRKRQRTQKTQGSSGQSRIIGDIRAAVARARTGRTGTRDYMSGIDDFRQRLSLDKIGMAVREMSQHSAYHKHVWPSPFPSDWSHLASEGFRTYLDVSSEIEWTAHALNVHGEKIQRFLGWKRSFDTSILVGDIDGARALLACVKTNLGVSLWLAEAEIALMQVTTDIHSQREFVRSIISESSMPWLARYLLYWNSLKFEENMSVLQLSRLIGQNKTGGAVITNLLRISYGEDVKLSASEAAEVLSHIDTLPVIDRYLFFIKVVHSLIAKSQDGLDESGAIKRALSILSRSISDAPLARAAFLCGLDFQVHNCSAEFIDGLDLYTVGDYGPARNRFEAELDNQPGNLAALGAYVRAQLNEGVPTTRLRDDGTVFDQIQKALYDLYQYGPSSVDARRRLQRIALLYGGYYWAPSIQVLVIATPPNLDKGFSKWARLHLALRVEFDSPLLASLLPPRFAIPSYIRAVSSAAPEGMTAQLYETIFDADRDFEEFFEQASLPAERRARYEAIAHSLRGARTNAIAALERVYKSGDDGRASLESGLALATLLLSAGRLGEAADVSAEIYLRASYFATVLPLKDLVAQIVAAQEDGADNGARGSISVAIVTDMYTRYVASDQESARSDAYKDFLRAQGVNRASELGPRKGEYDEAKLTYFLRYVCVPEVTDQSLALASTSAVEDERVAVLILLTELTPEIQRDTQLSILEELRSIRTRQVVRDTNTRLDQSKIFVNVEGIRKSIDVSMRDNWNRYRLLLIHSDGTDLLLEIERILEHQIAQRKSGILIAPKPTERGNLFQQMIREIRTLFVDSKEFGLDANLSANIRHGYILRELRSPLLAANLITNRPSESSPHEPNEFWPNRLPLLTDKDKEKLQTVLLEFSDDIDKKIDSLNDRYLRIQSSSNPDGMFSYPVTEFQLGRLKRRCEEVDTYEEFIDVVINYFWAATDYNLIRVRQVLEKDILQGFLDAVGGLEKSLDLVAPFHRLVSLRTAVNLVRPEVRAAIERVSNWFTLSKEIEHPDYSVETALQAGLETIKSYAVHNTVNSELNQSGEIMLRGWTLPFIGRIIFIILDNIVEHARIPAGELWIRSDIKIEDGFLSLNIRNKLGESADLDAIDRRVEEVNSEYGSEKATQFISVERRSGYPKIWKILTHDLRIDHLLEVKLDRDARTFMVQIFMSAKGVVV